MACTILITASNEAPRPKKISLRPPANVVSASVEQRVETQRPEIWNHANFHFKENCPAKLSDHHGTAQDFGEFRCI